MKWLDLAKILSSILIPFINPKLAPLAPVIANGINEAEAIPGASGADKLQHVVNIATSATQGINTVAGKTVVDPDHVTQTAAATVSAIVDVVNLVHDNQVVAPATPTTPPSGQ